ncbi:MAG: enoyl-CoA hydratase/isomerase family protein [Pseudomonadota bacterium]|nr:enoyl-CoA hydratase/isomerase family protein [Pseudomonadota bacterium]
MDGRFCAEFAEAAAACEANRDIAVILLAARGEAFSVGGDLRDFVANRAQVETHVRGMAKVFHAGIMALRRAAAPVVAAVAGIAAGGGFSLVCGADLVIAARSARFVSAYTRTGLTPDGGGTFFLPRIVGLRAAFDIMATNPTLTAEEAKTLGIVSRVVEDSAFDAEVDRLLGELSTVPADALAGLKRLLLLGAEAQLEAQLAAEGESIARRAADPETLRRLDAFLAKGEQARVAASRGV